MTTVIYDHKSRMIAVDGRTTAGMHICCENAKKWIVKDNQTWFLAGAVADKERFIDHLSNPESDAPKWQIECSGFLVEDSRVYQCVIGDDGEPIKSEIHYSDQMGSGGVYALAALDFGEDVFGAIRYAAKRDAGTGGAITAMNVDTGEFSSGHC